MCANTNTLAKALIKIALTFLDSNKAMTNQPVLYVKGTFNGWGLDTPLTQNGNGQLEAEIVFSADEHQFKITDRDGSDEWTLTAHPTQRTTLTVDQAQPLIASQGIGNDLCFIPPATQRFQVLVTLSEKPSLTIMKATTGDEATRSLISKTVSVPTSQPTLLRSAPHALAADSLFDAIAIERTETFPFVFGDNVDGYYEGKTHSLSDGGRYRHHQGWYLGTFASLVNGQCNDRSSAHAATLQAFGLQHHYSKTDSHDCISIVAGQRMAILSVESSQPAELGVLPELNIALAHSKVEVIGDVLLYSLDKSVCPEGCPQYIAISTSESARFEEQTTQNIGKLESAPSLSASNVALLIQTVNSTQSLSVYLCFEHQRDVALQRAQEAQTQHALRGFQQSQYDFLVSNYLWSDDDEYNQAVMWARLSSRMFVSHEFGTGIWAGLPWFKDCWGRDTFIALPGTSLINGKLEEAKAIIENFAQMQLDDSQSVNHGRIPNRVTSKTNIIYNTTDGTPWMIREIMEYINYSGDMAFASKMFPVMQRFIEGVETHYLDDDKLLKHRHPDTWMDAKIAGQVPWSPRGPKANDIQALWYEALICGAQLADLCGQTDIQQHWLSLSEQVKRSFRTKFWDGQTKQLADRLEENDLADYSLRPNQLMTLTIPQSPLVAADIGQHMLRNCVKGLLFPWGICSLEQSHNDFHPYHDGRDEYHKDAAYHNGTIWGWNAGFTISALLKFKQTELAYQLSKNLAKQILTMGHLGTMSENLDAFQKDPNRLRETGTYSQAWSVSEYARNAQQDYLGFTPKLSQNHIIFRPKIPEQWQEFNARIPFGMGSALFVKYQKVGNRFSYSISCENPPRGLSLYLDIEHQHQCLSLQCDIEQTPLLDCHFDGCNGWDVNVEPSKWSVLSSASYPILDKLSFAHPDWTRQHSALLEKDYLLKKRESEGLSIDKD
jgi:glycogen debranching enzyme